VVEAQVEFFKYGVTSCILDCCEEALPPVFKLLFVLVVLDDDCEDGEEELLDKFALEWLFS
jgi:hypothetical protein